MSGRGPEASLPASETYDLAEVDKIVDQNRWRRGGALEVLEDIQEEFGWVSPAAVQRVAELTDWSPQYLYGVVTFYDEFRIAPMGTMRVDICNGSACALNREDHILEQLERIVGVDEITDASPYELFTQNKFGYVTDDGKMMLRKVDCVGACQLAPLFRVHKEGQHDNVRFVGPVTPEGTRAALEQAFAEFGEKLPASTGGEHAPGDRFQKGNLGL